jgi:hypothetical protein
MLMIYGTITRDLSKLESEIYSEESWTLPTNVQSNLRFLREHGRETDAFVSIRAAVQEIFDWVDHTPVGFFIQARATSAYILKELDRRSGQNFP